MKKIEQRAYIKTCVALNERPVQILAKLKRVHGEEAYSPAQVKRLVKDFKDGRIDLEDKHRSGRPITACTQSNIDLVESIISRNPRVSYAYLEEQTFLYRPALFKILHNKLKLTKKNARWVPYNLSEKNKNKRLEFAKGMLQKLDSGEWRLDQILTGDECIFYHRKIDKRQATASWKYQGEPPDALVKRDRFEPKTMFSIWFRSTGMVYSHAVKKGDSIDNKYYIDNCLKPAFREVMRQRPATGLRGIKLLHDNARPHVHLNVRNFIESNGVIEIDHPPYSPDLSPCDFWLFNYIKTRLGSYTSSRALQCAITKVLNNIPHSEYIKTFNKYKERLQLCVEAEGDYFEHFMK